MVEIRRSRVMDAPNGLHNVISDGEGMKVPIVRLRFGYASCYGRILLERLERNNQIRGGGVRTGALYLWAGKIKIDSEL